MDGGSGILALFLSETLSYDGNRYATAISRAVETFGTLANYFEKLYLMVPVKLVDSLKETTPLNLSWDKTEIVHLPYFEGDALQSRSGPLAFPWICLQAGSRIVQVLRKADVVGATVPSLMGNFTSMLGRSLGKPVFHYVRGDAKAHLAAVHPSGFSYYFYQLASLGLDGYVKCAIARGLPTFVVGGGLFKKYSPFVKPRSHLAVSMPVLSGFFQPPWKGGTKKPRIDRPRLLFVGRLSKEKRVEDLLQGLNILRQQGIEAEVDIVGDGPERKNLEDLAKQLQLENVKFLGLVAYGYKLMELYHQADLFILPSIVESLGAVLAEAMACALPVVATDVDGIPTIVKHEWNGLLVPPQSPDQLATAIKRIVSSPDLWNYLSRNSLETVEGYRVDFQMGKMVEIVKKICKN